MSNFRLMLYWARYGRADANAGQWDCPPLSCGSKVELAYRVGQRIAANSIYNVKG